MYAQRRLYLLGMRGSFCVYRKAATIMALSALVLLLGFNVQISRRPHLPKKASHWLIFTILLLVRLILSSSSSERIQVFFFYTSQVLSPAHTCITVRRSSSHAIASACSSTRRRTRAPTAAKPNSTSCRSRLSGSSLYRCWPSM